MKHKDESIGIYVHIPFCVRKCAYCDFLSFSADKEAHNKYVNSLCKQIDATKDNRSVASVYIGGGTPSVIDSGLIETILCKLKENFAILPGAEITIEVNPGTVSLEALGKYAECGINRLSIGLQSANDSELKALGRIHSYNDFVNTFEYASAAGFKNVNVDIMTALPNQTEELLNNTLDCIIGLNPEHISAYSLIIEEGTHFYALYKDKPVMEENEERKLYYLCRDRLINAGYNHYEISNFAKPGYESRHNSSYWVRNDYYGFGLGASSLISDHRIKNELSFSKYLEDPLSVSEDILLNGKDKMEEFMFLGLRRLEGIDVFDFNSSFNEDYNVIYGLITDKLIKERMLVKDGNIIRLSDRGIDYGNYVFSSFLL